MPLSRDTFLQQCKRRFGTANPERMQLAHWEWMVRWRRPSDSARQLLGLEPDVIYPIDDSHIPDWCFCRWGQSRTRMPGGRIICIGGEYEDWGDHDFCIYNDVIVLRPAAGADDVTETSGAVEIYGYPKAEFPPTDFHSANLVGDQIYIIGSIGYPAARREGVTPVYLLDTRDYRITPVETSGAPPGWIFKHYGSYDPAAHAITVRGGERHPDACDPEHPCPTAHRLHLADLRWEPLAPNGPDQRFLLRNMDRIPSHLLGELPLRPSLPHELLDPPDLYPQEHRIGVQGYRVTISVDFDGVRVRIEGGLAADVVDALLQDLLAKLLAGAGGRWCIEPMKKA